MAGRIAKWFHDLFEEHKAVRRIGVIGLYVLIFYVTVKLFSVIAEINMAAATAYATLCGLLGVVYKFYTDMREKDGD